MYSNWIVNKLREDNRIVKIYSEIIAKSLNEDSSSDLGLYLMKLFKSTISNHLFR